MNEFPHLISLHLVLYRRVEDFSNFEAFKISDPIENTALCRYAFRKENEKLLFSVLVFSSIYMSLFSIKCLRHSRIQEPTVPMYMQALSPPFCEVTTPP